MQILKQVLNIHTVGKTKYPLVLSFWSISIETHVVGSGMLDVGYSHVQLVVLYRYQDVGYIVE